MKQLIILFALIISFPTYGQEVLQVRAGYTSSDNTGTVTSFNSRQGAVVPQALDYATHYVPMSRTLTINGVPLDLSANRSWTINTSNGVASFNGRTGAVTPQTGDYSFGQLSSRPSTLSGYGISDGVSVLSSYANPSWLTSLAWSKITGAPSFVALSGTAGAGDFTYFNGTNWVPYTPPSPSISVTNNGSGVQTFSFTTFQGTQASANWTDQIGSPGTGISITNRTINATGEVLVNTLPYAATRSVDFASSNTVENINLAGNISFTAANILTGRSKTIFMTADASARSLSFPAGWVFIGPKPTSLAAGKKAVLHLFATATTDASIIATYNYQE